MIKRFSTYFISVLTSCNKLSKETDYPCIYFFMDFIWSFLRYGCSVRHYFSGGFWKVRGVLRKEVFTLRHMNQLITKYNDREYVYILKEKNKFNEFFSQFILREWLFCDNVSEKEFRAFVQKYKEVLVKPLDTYEGQGIYKISSDIILHDIGKYFNEYRAGKFMVEEISQNHPDMSFGSKALNTIRVYSFLDSQGVPHILKAILRCGTGNNIVDNFHSGGVGYEIDLKTGIVISTGRSWNQENIVIHPGTNLCIIGRHIPEWESVMSQCLSAAKLLPQCRYIAWDIAVTRKGVEFIEGNHDGDFDLLEFFGSNGYWKMIKKYIKK